MSRSENLHDRLKFRRDHADKGYMPKLKQNDVVVLDPPSTAYAHKRKAYVLGAQFGPALLVVARTVTEAYEEYAVRFCQECELQGEEFERALNDGEAEWTSDGPRWSDHYAWMREFEGKDAVAQAGRFFRDWR